MVALILGWACAPAPAPAEPLDPDDVLVRFECARCHAAEPVFAATAPERSCVGCHREVLAGAHDYRALPGRVAGWKAHLHRLNDSPDLAGLADRVTREWFVRYVTDPVDLRPHLPAEMPRMPIGPQDAEALADRLGLRPAAPSVPSGDPARGEAVLRAQCLGCHALSGEGGGAALALDLAVVRHRSTPDQVERWLTDPAAVVPGTPMPDPKLGPADRADVVAALFVDRPPAPRPAVPAPAPLPERPVTWEEVDQLVFREVCRHCHADPVPVGGDGGPGNTGGFGFAGAGLDLSSREAVVRGGRSDVLALLPDGTPRLVAHLRARHLEVAGERTAWLGMPLGLPPLPPERIALVEAWIRQGAPE